MSKRWLPTAKPSLKPSGQLLSVSHAAIGHNRVAAAAATAAANKIMWHALLHTCRLAVILFMMYVRNNCAQLLFMSIATAKALSNRLFSICWCRHRGHRISMILTVSAHCCILAAAVAVTAPTVAHLCRLLLQDVRRVVFSRFCLFVLTFAHLSQQ